MFSRLRNFICIALSWALILTPALPAQQTGDVAAPVPPQLLHAHSVFVSNGGGSNYFTMFGGGPDRAYNSFYSELKKTGHYQLVSSPAEADLIFEIRAIAPAVSGNGTPAYNPQVVLTVRDPKSNVVLWTTSANVRAIGTKKHRDRDFDQSVAVLVDKLAEVTGEPLTEAQTKAIDSNSRMSTAAKAIIFAAIAGGAAITAYGIHMAMNPPAPPHEGAAVQ